MLYRYRVHVTCRKILVHEEYNSELFIVTALQMYTHCKDIVNLSLILVQSFVKIINHDGHVYKHYRAVYSWAEETRPCEVQPMRGAYKRLPEGLYK